MTMIVEEPATEARIRAEREASGTDLFDEVRDGVYCVSPSPNHQHQKLISRLSMVLEIVVDNAGLGEVVPTINVSDRADDWTQNYRVPDLSVFLNGTTARNLETHWLGGPDLAVEILSPRDRARERLDFYAGVGVREVLLIDRAPWRVELYRRREGRLESAASADLDATDPVASEVLPLSFLLAAGQGRPTIEVIHADGRRWSV